ncbi:MAG TPA: hypothetical protein VMO26_09945 [Vicinamibacterales bacterium]|nr:hypothetical protein [Vicinamibacterales bacterium]
MVWFFERDAKAAWIETRFDDSTGEYVVVIAAVGGASTVERYSELTTFDARIVALQAQFRAERWTQVTGAAALDAGWQGPR